jgi:phosphomannomutase
MAAGPNRMNEAVVVRATAGLAAWLTDQGSAGQPVIVGFDARHHSSSFAAAAASVLAAAGFPVLLADRPVPTPVLAFGVLDRGCCAGIQVTASHNPPADNGYKVYVADGAQIVPPTDAEISAAIDAVGPLPSVARDPASPLITAVGSDLIDAYVAGAVDTALRSPDRPRDVSVVYTPMHGVGRDVVLPAFAAAGFPAPDVVPEQGDPDPDFPTVAFPNPEEPGALDLALARAAAAGADVIVANDPDADRLAIAVPVPGGGWRPLTGDEVGAVLADWLLSHGSGPDRLVATTIVSSSLLSRLAAARGVRYDETLTGFKWIMRSALGHPELTFVYGYEEALGSCVGTLVHDKDGITAALAFAELVAAEKARGRTVLDRLDDLHRELGVHATGQRSVVVPGAEGQARMRAIVDELAASPPATLAGRPVTSVDDLRPGGDLPPTDAVVLRADHVRLIVRPSGTEPKLKCYAEAVVPPPIPHLPTARAEAKTTVEKILTEALTLAT